MRRDNGLAMTTLDAELVRAARAGESSSLGLLLERHRPALLAHALHLLGGSRAQAYDAVQDTFMVALCKLESVREPAAIGGWLHVVLRNVCLMQLRSRDTERCTAGIAAVRERSISASVDEALDRIALRAWLWEAIDGLSEVLQAPLVLRCFSGASSYGEIAALCGVPVGTVRSRLNEAKRRLAEALLDDAAVVDSAPRAEAERSAREFEELTAALSTRHDIRAFAERCAPDVEIRLGERPAVRGRGYIAQVAEQDFQAGVAYSLTNVVAGNRVIVAEGRFESPADDPHHCPPSVVQVHFRQAGWTRRIVMHYRH